MARSWASIMGAIRYGYKPFYILRLRGIPVLFTEVSASPTEDGEAIAPTGYELDASLVIDDSPRIGPKLDEKSHLPKAFDFTARLLDTQRVKELMQRPTLLTTMSEDIDAVTETIPVESTAGWDITPKPTLYYGLSCTGSADYGYLRDAFVDVVRDSYGQAKSYKAGTVVSDRPRVWKGRVAELFVALIDPLGRVVQGADVLSDACMIQVAHLQARPTRQGATWLIQCRDQARRLTEPLGLAANGKAVWSLEDDHGLIVKLSTTIGVRITIGADAVCDIEAQPFLGQTNPIPRTQIRKLVADALFTKYGEMIAAGGSWVGEILGFDWVATLDGESAGMVRKWRLIARLDTDLEIGGTDMERIRFKVRSVGGETAALRVTGPTDMEVTITRDSSNLDLPSPLYQHTSVTTATLAVILEEGTYARLPDAGWVLLESEGIAERRRYVSKSQDPSDYRKVILELANEPTQSELQILAAHELAGDVVEISAKFLWSDEGKAPDIMRRSIVSSGDAVNGAYDTLPRGQGYDLPYLDETSFDETFDGAFRDLSFDLAVDGGSSFEENFGDLLRLSQRAIVTRRAADGSAVEIAAVSVGSPDAMPVATITEATLVALDGRKPIRPVDEFVGPSAIAIKSRRMPVGTLAASEAELEYFDEHLTDWTGVRWELELYGLTRRALELPASVWSRAWFRGGENRQIVEIDIPPWVGADGGVQVGDIIMLEIPYDPELFDYAAGSGGLSGLARVLGALFSLQDGVVTLLVQTDGITTPGPMSPSIPIAAVNGTATSPTSIDVDDAYLALLTYGKNDAASWKLIAYLPGQDAGRAEYTITTITQPGGGVVRLTVSAYPSSPAVTLTTSYRLTWPVEDNSTENQNRFLHTSHRVQWS